MNKTAIKNFAVWARCELISRVSQKAVQYGISEKECLPATADSVNGKVLTAAEKKQRMQLISRIHRSGYTQTMEEIAYTWFNRFCALRFMEVNGYLPSLVRVFTDEEGAFNPQILADAIHLELDGLDRDKIFALKDANRTEELYKYLLITQCNSLNAILSGMFQKIEDETELLFPDNLLREESVIAHMIREIPEDDWKNAVQIIGWLYQYYNSEPKDQVFANLKKNIKISKENIPAATQLFTPDWIVRYMVENSLSRIFINAKLGKWTGSEADRQAQEKAIADSLNWKYYLPEAEQPQDVRAELNQSVSVCDPEKLKVIDPCMGSGHILVYMFDVLMQIYRESGYDDREAVANIVSNNLFGLDIDDRAAQLAYFAVMMKARQYDRGFFRRHLQPRVYAICESNNISPNYVDYFCKGNDKLAEETHRMIAELHDAKEYGSILNVTPADFSAMYARLDEVNGEPELKAVGAVMELRPLIQCAEAMAQKYDAIVTNPPYMGSSGMSLKLSDFVKAHYPDTKSDMSTVFMEKTLSMCLSHGYMAIINIPVWMFLSSYEILRKSLIENNTFVNMAHCGRGIFGSDFGTTSFVISKKKIGSYHGSYLRLFDKQGEVDSVETKETWFLGQKGIHFSSQDDFIKVPGSPIAYWLSNTMFYIFEKGVPLENFARVPKGLSTGSVDIFLRYWFEVERGNINFYVSTCDETKNTTEKWYPYAKGGAFRKWTGNYEFVVNWKNNGFDVKNFCDSNGKQRSRPQNTSFYFKKCMTYSAITSYKLSVRFLDKSIFGGGGDSIHITDDNLFLYFLGFINSELQYKMLGIISPTINFEVDHIKKIPIIFAAEKKGKIDNYVAANIKLSKTDWDSFETSWDFVRHPLAFTPRYKEEQLSYCINSTARREAVTLVSARFEYWKNECEQRFHQLKANEEELNRIFIDIYGLQDELTPEVEDKDITVRKADLGRDIRSLLSYAVGCMFGRYSLDVEGLAYAGGDWDGSKYTTFPADKDNVIPICDDDYFEDDLTGRFVKFIETVYGAETLEENLNFIAGTLGGRGSAQDVIRRYFRNDFFEDHCKLYQKRPIYWLFDSGKKGGFRALMYMHRYRPDTLATLRTDYVHEQQERYRTAIAALSLRVDNASGSEKVKFSKQLALLRDQAEETRIYEEKVHHLADQMISIDLDNGVKHNYALFQEILAKIK